MRGLLFTALLVLIAPMIKATDDQQLTAAAASHDALEPLDSATALEAEAAAAAAAKRGVATHMMYPFGGIQNRRQKRTPFIMPSSWMHQMPRRRSSNAFYPTIEEETAAAADADSSEDEAENGIGFERRRRFIYYLPRFSYDNSPYSSQFAPAGAVAALDADQEDFQIRKRGIPYYYPFSGSKRFWNKRQQQLMEDTKRKRGLLLEDLANDDPLAFGWDRKRSS